MPSFLPVNVLVNLIAVNQMDPYDSDSSDGGPEFPSQSTIPETLPFNDPNCVVTVLMELLGGQGCRSLRSFSTPLIPYPAQ
jgi:hypothetical protein